MGGKKKDRPEWLFLIGHGAILPKMYMVKYVENCDLYLSKDGTRFEVSEAR